MPTLGSKIRYFRKRAGLTQLALELELEAAPGSVSRIENDETNPTKETLEKISRILKLTECQFSYLAGDIAHPPTLDEIVQAQSEIKTYFSKKGVLSYMVDDRSRIWAASKDFARFVGFTDEQVSRILGMSIIQLVLDDTFGISRLIDEKDLVIRNLLERTYNEMSFMEGDELFEEALCNIKCSPLGNKIWNEISSNPALHVYDIEKRKVSFKIKGFSVSMIYAVEPLLNNERFKIVDYTPTSKVIRFLSRL